jgi:hypothetical protein
MRLNDYKSMTRSSMKANVNDAHLIISVVNAVWNSQTTLPHVQKIPTKFQFRPSEIHVLGSYGIIKTEVVSSLLEIFPQMVVQWNCKLVILEKRARMFVTYHQRKTSKRTTNFFSLFESAHEWALRHPLSIEIARLSALMAPKIR